LKIPFPGASTIRSLTFSPDGRTIAAAGRTVVRLFDAASGRSRVEIGRRAIGLRFAPDGATLVGAVGGTIYRWDAATGRSLIPEGGESPVDHVAATPDGALVVTLGRDGDAHLWDARTGEHRRRIDVWEMHGLALSPDGRFLAWPVADEAITFPSAEFRGATRTGCRIRMMDLGSGAVDERFGGFAGEAFDLFFIGGGKSLVTVDRYTRDGDVRVWEVATGRLIRSFDATWKPESRVWRSRPSPDGKTLAIHYQGEMRGVEVESAEKLWDLATGAEIAGPAPPWLAPDVLAFTPDGKSFAFATPDGKQIHLRDASTGQAQGELLRTPQRTTALAFGPDDRLYTGFADGTVLAWPVRRP
jgi:WD40 repeat protein